MHFYVINIETLLKYFVAKSRQYNESAECSNQINRVSTTGHSNVKQQSLYKYK